MKFVTVFLCVLFTADALAQSARDSATSEDWQTSFSGVKYLVIKEGDGKEAYANRRITVRYKGWLQDGTVFDSSGAEGFTFVLGHGQVIKGWEEGIRLMSEGSIYRLVIPPKLAYGKKGVPGTIPPNATLIFEVELLKVENL